MTISRSFFGGNPSKAHFVCGLPYMGSLPAKERALRKNEMRAVLKEAGFKDATYFEFTVGNNAAKEIAKSKAEALASSITSSTGITMEVAEGCFL